MATKIQLEAMVTKILELQYYGADVFSVIFDPFLLAITSSKGKIFIDTDGKEMKKHEH